MSGILVLLLRAVMAICLFAFVGFVIYIIWKDLRQLAAVAAGVMIPDLILEAEGQSEPYQFLVKTSEAIIGRDPSCDVFLDESTLSARHARLSFHHAQWWLEDLHSTNGSLLNDQPVLQPTVLDDGDRIKCGSISMIVHFKSTP